MKAILTFCAIFLCSLLLTAQESTKQTQNQHIEILTTVEERGIEQLKKRIPKKRNIARLYLFKNSRVKKELWFKTKKNKAKLA